MKENDQYIAKLTEVIAKAGGNISSIMQMDTAVMGIKEIVLRVQMENTQKLPKLIRKLQESGFVVREVDNEEIIEIE